MDGGEMVYMLMLFGQRVQVLEWWQGWWRRWTWGAKPKDLGPSGCTALSLGAQRDVRLRQQVGRRGKASEAI